MKERSTVKPDFGKESKAPPRGRPRNQKARAAVIRAASALLNEGGLGAVTIETLTARTGVSKPTIYRTWPNAHAVAMSALMDAPEAPLPSRRRTLASLLALRKQLHTIVEVFSSKTGRSVTHVLAAADPGTELSKVFRNRFILTRREEGRGLLTQAMAEGEIRRDLDMEAALDLIYAPVFYRLLVGHAPINNAFVNETLDLAIRGLKQE
jgi:AcrR family transcriptional regulator